MPQAKPEVFAYPFPVLGRGPNLSSQDRCMRFIRTYQQQGRILACVHAKPAVIERDSEGGLYYGVRCARASFDIHAAPPGTFGGLGIAQASLGFYGCPPECHYQQGAWQARLQQLREVPGRLLAWFADEVWQVKVAVLAVLGVLILAIRGAEALRALAELVRAFFGK